MWTTAVKAISIIVALTALATAVVWLLRPPSDELIPKEFRGAWLDRGAECNDTSAQVRITGSTVNYDRLSFKADAVVHRDADTLLLNGSSFAGGDAQRATVQLRMQDRRSVLFLTSADVRQGGPFFRCASNVD